MSKTHQIREGINYLRMLNRGTSVTQLAEDLMIDEQYIKDCIKAARQHKDESETKPKVKFVEPFVKIHKNLSTGEYQKVAEVEIELLRDIIVKFDTEEESEFQTMLPVNVKITRKHG